MFKSRPLISQIGVRNFTTPKKKNKQSLVNFVYFHKKRISVGVGFCAGYALLCKSTISHKNEAIRLGIAGSLANCFCECAFHIIDTVNIRAKVDVGPKSTY